MYWLTMGRDFTADGTIEAAEVREGDQAPDGSGPLHLERGIEVGHIFQLGRKYAKSLGLTVLDQNGKSQVVTMGSYGIGVSRVLAALAESNSDERGLAWPANIAPLMSTFLLRVRRMRFSMLLSRSHRHWTVMALMSSLMIAARYLPV